MLISLNWIRDFVDCPAGLDARALGEQFTVTTAEVEDVHEIKVGAAGLVAARVVEVAPLAAGRNLRRVTLDLGGRTIETVSAAPDLPVGATVVYAPPGARVASLGDIVDTTVAGQASTGMILPGEALGIAAAIQEAVFLPPSIEPGQPLDGEAFDDWVIEVDNKSITHRPDLWGHYGIAREIAAILSLPLKPYPVVPLEELTRTDRPEVPVVIADPESCRRYSALVLGGVPTQPAPLWMQLRLGHVGLRPISGLVDLTNYLMAELGQPMHAFDAAKVDRIEVDRAKVGDRFRTLDGVERTLNAHDLMIQSGGRSVAIAGVMGGQESEVTAETQTLLLESANFDAATIRRTATRLALRTDASARFEKSLDPAHTVLAIQRFVQLARTMYPKLALESRLSDAYPRPFAALDVEVKARHVARTLGQRCTFAEAQRLLAPLGFILRDGGESWSVKVPSFRATGDVAFEADVIEEIARFVGYGNITPAMPAITMRRFEPNALHELEQRTLEYFTTAHGFHEIHGYLWYDDAWLRQLGVAPAAGIELRNPAAEGLHRLRDHLLPGLLAATARNRFFFDDLALLELGSVFASGADTANAEQRHLGLVLARRARKAEEELLLALKGAIESWAWNRFTRPVAWRQVAPRSGCPWDLAHRTAEASVDGMSVGRVSVIDASLRRAMDEHLSAWAVAWAEVRLSGLEAIAPRVEALAPLPAFPLVELDFSFLVPVETRYADVASVLGRFRHPLLKRLHYLSAYQGEALGNQGRSLTFRAILGDENRTLTEADSAAFRAEFERMLTAAGFALR